MKLTVNLDRLEVTLSRKETHIVGAVIEGNWDFSSDIEIFWTTKRKCCICFSDVFTEVIIDDDKFVVISRYISMSYCRGRIIVSFIRNMMIFFQLHSCNTLA
jgi:hypothetical protein